jgi:hypothetical protein
MRGEQGGGWERGRVRVEHVACIGERDGEGERKREEQFPGNLVEY